MSDVIYFAKQSSGCILRRTRKHDGSSPRYYGSVEILGKTRFVRISKDVYDRLNDVLAVSRCAFTTNIRSNGTVQQQHAIQLK